MGELVRDRIPEIIRAEGRTADTRLLDDDAYRAALLDKLVEEALELRAAPPGSALDEAADVYEVLLALAALEGWALRDVASHAAGKRRQRGGFDERVFLQSSSAADSIQGSTSPGVGRP
ncbi:MAG TPA: nucleoside triphosphate pyrophosphohydrolase [Nocardioidaceae bacterium]|nr:nucleoside triphosphate pyrophosphohydrolase [Nocardioidaceae bacterium]